MIDTSVAVLLRDGDPRAAARLQAREIPAVMSIITRVELEAGVSRAPDPELRRRRLDALLRAVPARPFGDAEAAAYGRIVAAVTYSRRKVLDRMIAAQALVARAELMTLNPQDFSDVPGLVLAKW